MEISKGENRYICREQVPEITGLDENVANKIEENIKNKYIEVWTEINKQYKDEDIKSILKDKDQYYESYEIGFKQSCKPIYLNNRIITFNCILEGGIGGISLATKTGITFDLKTGEAIKVEDIVLSKDEYIKACKEYVFKELENDSRYQEVLKTGKENYELVINTAIEKIGGYFTSDGIVCVEIPKGSIAGIGSGEFRYTVPYNTIKKYISSEYDFSDYTNKANNIKEEHIDNTKTKGTVPKK